LNLASGATEVALTIKSFEHSVVPHVANLETPIDDELNMVMKNEHRPVNRAIKVAVGFGANCAALAFQKFKE
jgi:3-oxoacyl-(acyl-carrier-protein) synthase